MNRTRKELINMEMSMIMRRHQDKMRVIYGCKTQNGHVYDGRFHMNRRPQISAILDHLFRNI